MRFNIALLFALTLVACSTTNDSRYQDNAHLERPPEMPIPAESPIDNKQVPEPAVANEIAPPKKHHFGLGLKSDVYLVENSTSELRVKRSFDEVWGLLNQAFLRNGLKVTDQDRSKGVYYVLYNDAGFLGKAFSYFKDEHNQSTYLLKVEPQGEETSVVVSLANKEDQTAQTRPQKEGEDKEDGNSQDSSQQLLELLHNTLEDDVKD